MNLTELTILELNNAYIRLTGYPSLLRFRKYQWERWLTASDPPWTVADLECVVNYIKKHMGPLGSTKHAKGYTDGSLKFYSLVEDISKFMDLLGVARAESRVTPPTPKAEMLKATGRPEPVKDTARPAGQVLSGSKAFEDFRKWRAAEGLL